MIVAIHQPNYVPWCGYFAKMMLADIFIFLDDANMSKGSYISRCQIRNNDVAQWISVPVHFHSGDPINAVRFGNTQWAGKHVRTLKQVYGRCRYFDEVMTILSPAYANPGDTLGRLNIRLIRLVADYLGLTCRVMLASELECPGESDDRLVALVQSVHGDTYLSGKGGQNYQDPRKFASAGIQLVVRAYKPIPYEQGHPQFLGGLSILDALFMLGSEATRILTYSD